MKNIQIYFILLFMFLSGCHRKKEMVITYDLKKSDYVETIEAGGTIQAVNNVLIKSPQVPFSNLVVAYLAKDGAHVKKGDTVCILEAPELVYYIENFKVDLEKMEADMKKLEADNAMEKAVLKAQVETNKAQIAISSLDSIQMKFAPAIKKQLLALEMEKASVEKKKLQKKFAAQVKIDNSEVSQLRSRIMIQKNRIKVFEDQQKSLTLVSPDDGVIMHYEAPLFQFMGSRGGGTIGGKIEVNSTVWDNTPVLQLPDMKEMQVSVEVPEADYKRIQNNQKVMIRVDASDNLTTTGKILRKTLAGKNNNREKTAIKNYEVIVKIDSCHLKMKPGLSASCQIIVDQLKDTIVVPSTAIFTRDSLKIIYVAKGEKFRPVVVETGLFNNSKSVITKGLSGNETIALMEPPFKLMIKEGKEKIGSSRGSGSKAGRSANDSVALR